MDSVTTGGRFALSLQIGLETFRDNLLNPYLVCRSLLAGKSDPDREKNQFVILKTVTVFVSMLAVSSNSPCAACKFLRRKCTPECIFAPYFPPDSPQKFANVHKVFGASNVSKLLNELHPRQREDAVNSLAFEAEARLNDPVYGCVGIISVLQYQLKQLQADLDVARSELGRYMSTIGMTPPLPASFLQAADISSQHQHQPQQQNASTPAGSIQVRNGSVALSLYRDQQTMDSQQVAAAAMFSAKQQPEIIKNYFRRDLMRSQNSEYVSSGGRVGFNHHLALFPPSSSEGVTLFHDPLPRTEGCDDG